MKYSICGVHERDEVPGWHTRSMHSHPDHEIFLLLSGEIEYRVEGSIYPMQAGDLVLMKKGEVHIPTILSASPYE